MSSAVLALELAVRMQKQSSENQSLLSPNALNSLSLFFIVREIGDFLSSLTSETRLI
jgi:hypothetical protein